MNQNEALAAEDNIEAVLENVRNMTSQEADAAVHKALEKCCVAVRAAQDASSMEKMAVRHYQALMESLRNNTMTGKMSFNYTSYANLSCFLLVLKMA